MKGLEGNGFVPIIARAIAEMEETHGEFKSIDEINLAELSRRTGLSRAKLRRLKANGFCEMPHGLTGQQRPQILDGYSAVLDSMIRNGVSNSAVCLIPHIWILSSIHGFVHNLFTCEITVEDNKKNLDIKS